MSTTQPAKEWFDKINTYLVVEAKAAGKPVLNSSWAVWKRPAAGGYSFQSNTTFPGRASARRSAHGEVIFLGMNPGLNDKRADWSNFHSSTTWEKNGRTLTKNPSNDHLIAAAAHGTRLWGGFMTDLFYDVYNSLSQKVKESTEGTDAAERGADRLLRLVRMLPPAEISPLVLCFGKETHDAFKTAMASLKAEARASGATLPDLTPVEVTHYSEGAHRSHGCDPATYRILVHSAIELAGRGDLLQKPK